MRELLLATTAALTGVSPAQEEAPRTDELRVLPPLIDGAPAGDMMKLWLRRAVEERHAEWIERFEARRTPLEIAAYQEGLADRLRGALGAFPDRTPLNAVTTGVSQRAGYRVERVLFESRPAHHVTALLYLPEDPRYAPPYPAVLVPCGHAREGKAYPPYQRASALLALNGIAALCFDPIDQGERIQLLDDEGREVMWGTRAHSRLGVASIFLGLSTAHFEIWDAMRALDYLESRGEIDGARLGCMGQSGGGTQTALLTALDGRVRASSPACYITSFERLVATIGVQDAEQNVFGQLAFGLDHADLLQMRAPVPTLVCAATRDFFDVEGTWESFRFAKRLYGRLGHPERIDLVEVDGEHDYDRPLREASVAWMARWLAGEAREVSEPEIVLLEPEESLVTPEGQVLLLEGERSVHERVREEAERLKALRALTPGHPDRILHAVRELTGIRPLGELPEASVQRLPAEGSETLRVERLVLSPTEGIRLPGVLVTPADRAPGDEPPPRLLLHDEGKGAALETFLAEGIPSCDRPVLALEPRGTGETRQTQQGYFRSDFGGDGQDVFTAYVLGLSTLGMRAEDVLLGARFLRERTGRPVAIAASGHLAVAALHAVALEPELFHSSELRLPYTSWTEALATGRIEGLLQDTVHGALRDYDLPDLERLGDGVVGR